MIEIYTGMCFRPIGGKFGCGIGDRLRLNEMGDIECVNRPVKYQDEKLHISLKECIEMVSSNMWEVVQDAAYQQPQIPSNQEKLFSHYGWEVWERDALGNPISLYYKYKGECPILVGSMARVVDELRLNEMLQKLIANNPSLWDNILNA